jgi:micrococcal nuclease
LNKTIKIKNPLVLSFLALLLLLAGFGAGRLTLPEKEPIQPAGILVLDPNQKAKVKVWYVIDGDSFKLKSGENIRLLGINAPSLNEPYGAEAQERLQKLVQEKEVELEFDSQRLRDQYGRLLAYVWVGNILVNELLIKEGLAEVIAEEIQKDFKYKARFLEAQDFAQNLP